MEIMQAMADLNPRIYVPGHGPHCDQSGLQECREYLRLVYDEGRKLFESGMGVFDTAQKIHLGRFKKWGNWERIAGNVDRLFREFKGEQPNTEVDIPLLIGWMNKLAASG
jgi:cyclase